MIPFNILAESVTAAQAETQAVVPIDTVWASFTSLNILEALTFISFGVVCLLYGWRVFKILVIISFALIGMLLGIAISSRIGGQNQQIIGAIIGLVLMALVSVPLMRWAVSILGAVAGGIITSGVWYACGLPEQYIWAGGLVGFVAGGMISFIVFKIAIMLFSSLGGSALVVTGLLALLYLYSPTAEDIQTIIFDHKWFLPVAVSVPTAIGMLIQNKFIKKSSEWSV